MSDEPSFRFTTGGGSALLYYGDEFVAKFSSKHVKAFNAVLNANERDTKALEADKARLDLLEKWLNETDYGVELRRYAPGQYWIETDKWEGQNGSNLREAIDGVKAP